MSDTIAGRDLPPEFKFRPTHILYGCPPSNVVYEDALGSQGKAPLDPRLVRRLDPINWVAGRSVMDNVRMTTHGVVSDLTHHLRHAQTPRTIMRKHEHPTNINTIIQEAPDARKPRVKGNRTIEQIMRGARATTPQPQISPDRTKIAQVVDPRRGWRVGSERSFAEFLSQHKAHTVESLASAHTRREERAEETRVRIGGTEFTGEQLASMPPGYVAEIIRRRQLRDAQNNAPVETKVFDPRESRNSASNGQYTEVYRPGLVSAGNGRWVRPEQFGGRSEGSFGALGANGQPKTAPWRLAAAVGLAVAGTLLGLKIIRG